MMASHMFTCALTSSISNLIIRCFWITWESEYDTGEMSGLKLYNQHDTGEMSGLKLYNQHNDTCNKGDPT